MNSSVSAPQPQGTCRNSLTTEPTGVLAKRVGTRGLCAPGAVSIVRIAMEVSEDEDPWFPIDSAGKTIESGDKATEQARTACHGCPVVEECRELTRREEIQTGDVHGIRGGLTAAERRASYRRANRGGGVR